MNIKLLTIFLSILLSSISVAQDNFVYKPCVNDTYSVIGAVEIDDEMIFCVYDLMSQDSLPNQRTRTALIKQTDSCYYEDATLYNKEINDYASLNVNHNTGPISVSSDGKLLFISNTYAGVSENQMGIFVLQKSIDGWKIQQEFPFNSSEYSVMHPAYDEEEGRMFFASNKDSEHFNLWYVDYDGTTFGDTLHEMTDINAIDANDVFPYIFDGTLYFSSDRKDYTFLNIYKARTLKDKWYLRTFQDSTLVSGYDDFSFRMLSNRTGVFTTTRFTNGKKDELISFRKKLDCSLFPRISNEKLMGEHKEQLQDALQIIEEFRNVFGVESELAYKLNVNYFREQIYDENSTVSDFYCNLFNYLDSASHTAMDLSLKLSMDSEELIDSLFNVIVYDLNEDIIGDSLLRILQGRYDELGLHLELEEQKAILKEAYEPLRALADSIVGYSDTLKKIISEQVTGYKLDEENLPEFAKRENGLFFAVQIGAFSKKQGRSVFANLEQVMEVPGPSSLHHYITGYCNSIDLALKAQAQVRGVGYPGAFIVAYCDGERIPIFKAKELMASGDCVPISQSEEPKIDYTIVINRPGTDEPFTEDIDPSYNQKEGAVKAEASEIVEELFYTVQIGVFDGPVNADEIHDMPDLITTLLPNGQIRYSSGIFKSEGEANSHVSTAKSKGIPDAYVTAYYEGKRITLSKAKDLLRQKGDGILINRGN